MMGVQAPPELLGIHTNMPGIFPADIDGAAFSGAPAPSGLSADEKLAYDRLQFRLYQKGIWWYGFQMARPTARLSTESWTPPSAWREFPRSRDRTRPPAHRTRLGGRIQRPHARRHPRQHHDRLVDEHGALRRAVSTWETFWKPAIPMSRASPLRSLLVPSLTSSIQPRGAGRRRRIRIPIEMTTS